MFHPPPTVIEVGTEEDMKQFEETMHPHETPSPLPSHRSQQVFDSPSEQIQRPRQFISTPTASISSPL